MSQRFLARGFLPGSLLPCGALPRQFQQSGLALRLAFCAFCAFRTFACFLFGGPCPRFDFLALLRSYGSGCKVA